MPGFAGKLEVSYAHYVEHLHLRTFEKVVEGIFNLPIARLGNGELISRYFDISFILLLKIQHRILVLVTSNLAFCTLM